MGLFRRRLPKPYRVMVQVFTIRLDDEIAHHLGQCRVHAKPEVIGPHSAWRMLRNATTSAEKEIRDRWGRRLGMSPWDLVDPHWYNQHAWRITSERTGWPVRAIAEIGWQVQHDKVKFFDLYELDQRVEQGERDIVLKELLRAYEVRTAE